MEKEYVIINEYDKPCTRLIAQVVKVEGDKVTARYITDGTRSTICTGRLSDVMPVARFGVTLNFEGRKITGVQSGECTATYRDGTPRTWQPEAEETHSLKDA